MQFIQDDPTTLRAVADRGQESADWDLAVINHLQSGTAVVLIDLADLEHLHSPSLATLTALHLKLAQRNIQMSIINPSASALRAFHHTRLDELLDIRSKTEL